MTDTQGHESSPTGDQRIGYDRRDLFSIRRHTSHSH